MANTYSSASFDITGYPSATIGCCAEPCQPKLTIGDRVRIRAGYEGAGSWGFYRGKSLNDAAKANITWGSSTNKDSILAESIELYPYTREERIARAIEDLNELLDPSYPGTEMTDIDTACIYAILDAGV